MTHVCRPASERSLVVSKHLRDMCIIFWTLLTSSDLDLWPFKLKIGLPVTPFSRNVHTEFGFSVLVYSQVMSVHCSLLRCRTLTLRADCKAVCVGAVVRRERRRAFCTRRRGTWCTLRRPSSTSSTTMTTTSSGALRMSAGSPDTLMSATDHWLMLPPVSWCVCIMTTVSNGHNIKSISNYCDHRTHLCLLRTTG